MSFDFAADAVHAGMHGYAAANGLSAECRANRHDDCVAEACVCACHAQERHDAE